MHAAAFLPPHLLLPLLSLLLLLQGALDNVNLFQVITIMAFFTLLPFSLALEGLPALPTNLTAAVGVGSIATLLLHGAAHAVIRRHSARKNSVLWQQGAQRQAQSGLCARTHVHTHARAFQLLAV